MDGWWNTTTEYERFIRVFGRQAFHPWVHALRNPLILEKWDDPQIEKKLWEGLKQVWTSGTAGMNFRLPVDACDVLMYCSSDKPSVQPAMDWLARRLGQAGMPTVHWGSTTITCYLQGRPDHTLPAKGIRKALGFALRQRAICDIPRSLWFSLSTFATALAGFRPFAKRFTISPRRLFSEIATNRHMTRVLREFLATLKPKLILTNGEQTPVGCALTAAARKEGIRVVWFFNEWPTSQMMPVLSDEIWVWNNAVADTLKAIHPVGFPAPNVQIIGMAQLDCMQEQASQGDVVAARLPGPRCLVFLSEYIPAYAHHNRLATELALRWLAEAASLAEDWHFVIKPRSYHDTTPLPGEQYLQGHKNIMVMRDGVSMAALVAAPEVEAIAALSSSGLLLGAATGRKAFRLLVSENPYPIPSLDRVVQAISSPEMLVRALGKSARVFSAEAFPNRGKVLATMEALVRQRVGSRNVLAKIEV